MTDDLQIPRDLLPADGRFGAGPSKIQTSHLDALAATGSSLMGTSHRQAPVRSLVGRVREGLAELFSLPDGYEVVLGNGGATAFWDIATYGLIEERSQHLSFGEFSSKFAAAASAAPWLYDPTVIASEPGTAPVAVAEDGVDVYAWAQNETSTAVMAPVVRPTGASPDSLVLIDATSGAGGLPVDVSETDVYYFAPQKCFASDGGLWIALMSPAALSPRGLAGRVRPAHPGVLRPDDRHLERGPEPDLQHPVGGDAVPDGGAAGLDERLRRARRDGRADHRVVEHPLRLGREVAVRLPLRPGPRPPLPGDRHHRLRATPVDAAAVAAVLRANGIVDTEPYRKLGRNQLPHRDVPRRRPHRRRGAHHLHRLGRRASLTFAGRLRSAGLGRR